MSKYGVGLRNAGSYIVSGKPYISRQSLNKGQEVKIEFPSVAKNVTIKIPSPPNNGYVAGPAVGTAAWWWGNQTGYGGLDDDGGNLPELGDTDDYTYSLWFKYPIPDHDGWPINFYGPPGTGAFKTLVMMTPSNTQLQFYISEIGDLMGSNDYDSGLLTVPDITTNWNHLVITQLGGNTYFYVNTSLLATATGIVVGTFDDILKGYNSGGKTARHAEFDEETLWNVGMTGPEVTELYNSGEWFNPNEWSLADNLVAWWTYGDSGRDAYVPDLQYKATLNVISNQATGTSADSDSTVMLKTFDLANPGFFPGPGPFTSQTTGKLRAHMLSTGSANGARVISCNHFQELQGYDTQIVLPMKTKEIYITAVDAQVTFEVVAELTNIPSGSMYTLGGAGIDD